MDRDQPLLDLLDHLKRAHYRFTAITPASHARVVARPTPQLATVRDLFGWSRSVPKDSVPSELRDLMDRAGVIHDDGDRLRSALRVASLGDDLFLHSAYPTDDADAVFFGPDTYRFARFIAGAMPPSVRHIVDMGAGSGAGGIFAARLAPDAKVTLVDTNPAALDLARVNAAAAGVAVETLQAEELSTGIDLVLANPPYLVDDGERRYRDGGGLLGGEVARAWVRDALHKLAPGGTMLLYTGVPFVGGISPLITELARVCSQAGAELTVEELDPDVFGEELDNASYAHVDRIAAVGAIIRKPAG